MHDIDNIETVLRYHERTKHRFNRYDEQRDADVQGHVVAQHAQHEATVWISSTPPGGFERRPDERAASGAGGDRVPYSTWQETESEGRGCFAGGGHRLHADVSLKKV